MGRLQSIIRPEYEDVGRPTTLVQIDFGDGPAAPMAALVDTGSTLTLGPLHILSPVRRAAVEQTPRQNLTGLGGGAHGYWMAATLLVGLPTKLRLAGVRICFTAAVQEMAQPFILGQRDFGERLRLVQLPASRDPRKFMLDEWRPRQDR